MKRRKHTHSEASGIDRYEEIDRLIPEAQRMSDRVGGNVCPILAFGAAMNWMTASYGLRMLTASENAFAENLYGDIENLTGN
jgi:hypothetical protein